MVDAESARGDDEAAKRRQELLSGLTWIEYGPAALDLARKFLDAAAIPETSFDDATHVAIATIAKMDYLADVPNGIRPRAEKGEAKRRARIWYNAPAPVAALGLAVTLATAGLHWALARGSFTYGGGLLAASVRSRGDSIPAEAGAVRLLLELRPEEDRVEDDDNGSEFSDPRMIEFYR